MVTADNLDIDLDLPYEPSEMTLPDIYVGLEVGLLAPGDGVITDRHHASASRYEADDPLNQIGGEITSFALSGWLRHGCERVVQLAGATACHPGEPEADYRRAEVYERDLDRGYHEKGACVDSEDSPAEGCVIHELFGGFGDNPGELLRRPVSFSPIRRQVDVTDGEAEAHYRELHTQVRSRNEDDGGQPLRHATRDIVGNLEGTWMLSLREVRPEFVGLLLEAVSFLDTHADEYEFQLGGSRNFGAGIADAWVVNPLYEEREIKRVFTRGKAATNPMKKKDEVWAEECRDEFVRALQDRITQRSDGDGLDEAIDVLRDSAGETDGETVSGS